jgi:O-antigen ligase
MPVNKHAWHSSPYYKVILKTIFLSGLIIMPLVFWPKAPIPYEIPRVWFIQRWIELLGIFTIISTPFVLKKEKVDRTLLVLITLFLGVVLIFSFLGADFNKSFWGNHFRGDGIFTLLHFTSFFLILVLVWNRSWEYITTLAISLGSILTSLWTLYLGFQFYLLGNPRASSFDGGISTTFGNPNFLAGYLLVTLPFLAYQFKKGNFTKKRFLILAILLQIFAILLTKAWGGIFGIFLFLAGWILITKKNKQSLYISIVFLCIVLTSPAYLSQQKRLEIPNRINAEARERIFMKGILAFQKRPFLGWGWANFDYAFDSSDWPIKIENDVYVDKAHSTFLEILTTTGLFGLLVYLAIVLRAAKNLLKSKRKFHKYALLALLLFIFHSQTNVISIAEELFFWLIIGMSAKTS